MRKFVYGFVVTGLTAFTGCTGVDPVEFAKFLDFVNLTRDVIELIIKSVG